MSFDNDGNEQQLDDENLQFYVSLTHNNDQ